MQNFARGGTVPLTPASESSTSPVQVPCCLCGSEGVRPLFTLSDIRFQTDSVFYTVATCISCGLTRLTPRPPLQRLSAYYPAAFYDHRVTSASRSVHAPPKARSITARRVAEKLRIVHAWATPPGALLDVGCAAGEFLLEARSAGWRVAGVEMNPDVARKTAELLGAPVTSGPVEDVPINGSFDVITLWATLEHLPNPRATLEKLARHLSPQGILVVFVPNLDSWESRIARKYWPHLDVPRHLYHFTPHTLAALAHACGFDILSLTTPRTSLAVSHWPAALLRRYYPRPSKAQSALHTLTRPAAALLDALAASRGRGHSILGIFRAPAP